ncbi:hypothetical protein D9M71_504680 [compost metagenome]
MQVNACLAYQVLQVAEGITGVRPAVGDDNQLTFLAQQRISARIFEVATVAEKPVTLAVAFETAA